MVEAIAKLCHPDGIEIGFDGGPELSAEQTMSAINANEVVRLFEATLVFQGRIRIEQGTIHGCQSRTQIIEVNVQRSGCLLHGLGDCRWLSSEVHQRQDDSHQRNHEARHCPHDQRMPVMEPDMAR